MEKIVSLCKRRGFIFQSSEIYGGLNGCWDYGPLGVELKRNVKNAWWDTIVRQRDDMVGLDSSIIMNPRVWEASGHVSSFNDPMADCKTCKSRFRADQVFCATARDGDNVLLTAAVEADQPDDVPALASEKANSKTRRRLEQHADRIAWTIFRADQAPAGEVAVCPKCGGELTEARKFNMMFKTYVGAMEDSSSLAYLRPETAQGIFANFRNVVDTSRVKLPFGIAQIGKSFRNEINPRNFTFRSREFEQMEIEFFCRPDEADRWYEYWRDARYQWYIDLGLTSDKLRLREHEPSELAHYAKACADVEYAFPFGTAELEGCANRTDFDLRSHSEASGKDLSYYDDETKERFIPYVIEPSAGADRATLAFLCEAYSEDEAPDENGVMQKRVVMKFHPRLAPVKAAVFPLVKKEGMPEMAEEIYRALKKAGLAVFYDEKGAVGRRYRRQDEVGTPYCVTVDGQSLTDGTVTIRDRDSLEQVRVPAGEVVRFITERLAGA
ncbi:MAG: glycine--tRNA ligase [Planctomycetes bacterium]|nr:glycine--tRNA ligase [Planctomycetota bacterium]